VAGLAPTTTKAAATAATTTTTREVGRRASRQGAIKCECHLNFLPFDRSPFCVSRKIGGGSKRAKDDEEEGGGSQRVKASALKRLGQRRSP